MDGGYELRRRAVELCEEGWRPGAVAAELGRSREWVRKWVHRYRTEGDSGLLERSRRPRLTPSRLGERARGEVIAIREALSEDRHANVGPKAIHDEIERLGRIERVPSLASIKRILAEEGLTRQYRKHRRTGVRLGLPKPSLPGVWQQADWVQDRHLEGGIRFSSLQIGDVGSHAMSSDQHHRRTVYAAAGQVTEQAWPILSIPYAMGADNAFSKTSHPNNPWTLWVKTLLMFGVEAIISPPDSLGFTNHVEACNWLWQDRTIDRWRYQSLEELRSDTVLFLDWANHRRSILDPDLCGTRYPAQHVTNHAGTLRWPPAGFTIEDYLDASHTNQMPITRGRVTFLRYVTEHHTITIAHTHWPIPDLLPIGILTVAAINTTTAQLEIRHQGDLIATHPYPMEPARIDPIHPISDHGLLDHLPTMS